MGPLLAIFAHPDDETFTSAGVLAAATERGIPVIVISATRGEAGESAVPGLEDPERLGVVRERELREAMRRLGVRDVRILGYRDSGIEGSAEAERETALVRAPIEAVVARLAAAIRAIRPQAILTFDPAGLYGHPDHLFVHRAAVAAVAAAADPEHQDRTGSQPWLTPALYFATFPREDMQALRDAPGDPLDFVSAEARQRLGTPGAEITHGIDIRPWADQKRAAIAAHRTQTGEGGPLADMPAEVRDRQLAHEWFVRAALPWPATDDADIVSTLAAERPAN
jgi:LmbE family N-acetylglucosaminyl deacetylase